MMKLLCKIGLHKWILIKTMGINDYYVCSNCNKRKVDQDNRFHGWSPVDWDWVSGTKDELSSVEDLLPEPPKITLPSKADILKSSGFKKVYSDDKSGYWWVKEINHPFMHNLHIVVDDNFLTVNASDHFEGLEFTLFSTHDNSINDILNVLRRFDIE